MNETSLRFCFLTTFYPPHNFGGDGIAVQRLARALVRAGHRVTVIHDADAFAALSPTPAPAAPPEPEGLTVVSLRSRVGALSVLLTQQLGRPMVHGRRIRNLLEEGEFDIINFHNVSLIGGPGLLEYGRGIKLYMAHEHWLVCPTHVLWRHGRELCTAKQCVRCQIAYKRPPQLWRLTGFLERQLAHVDAFIAMSEFSRDKHREFGFPRPMEVLPGFLPDDAASGEAAQVRRPQERPYFLFAGRLGQLKGLQDVIPLFRTYAPADLLIAGAGDYGATLRAQAAGVERVRFLGALAADDLARYYRHAVALIVPSLCYETFGLIVLEAFRQQTPVIARRLGPFPELVAASGGGELFENAEQLLDSMRRLQQDAPHRERLARAAYGAFRRLWTEEVVLPQYLGIVRSAAERRGDARVLAKLARGVAAPAGRFPGEIRAPASFLKGS